LAVRTSSSSVRRARNDRARFSVVFALLSLASIPAALYASRLSNVNVPQAVAGEAVVGTFFGLIAVLLARSARVQVERTLARTGEGAARAGKWLGLLGLCLGLTAALSLGFFGLLLWAE
jgi:hypothetical protein